MQTRTADPAHARRRAARVRGLAVAAVLGLTLTSCGGGDTGSTETSPSASASASSSASSPSSSPSDTAGAEGSGSSEGSAEAKEEYLDVLRQAAEEQETSVRTRSVNTVDTPQGPIETVVTGVTVVEDGTLSARLDTELPQGQGSLRTLIVDGTFYVQAPGVPQGKFVQVDLREAAGPLGEQLQQQLDQIDPRAQAESAIDSVTSVEDLGEDEVNGVEVTRYRVTQDFRAVVEAQNNAVLKQLLDEGIAPEELTSEVSVDDEGRVRRIEVELDVQGMTVTTVSDYLEYDVDVDITAPPRSKIAEMPSGG